LHICARCTKDACDNHLCDKCLRCSDCCECEVALVEPAPNHVAVAAEEAAPESDVALTPQEPDSALPGEADSGAISLT